MSQNSCGKSDKQISQKLIPAKSCARKSKKRRRKGKITKNPFFNFLRFFRMKHRDWTVPRIAVEGAKCWCSLTEAEKKKFYKQAHQAFLRSMRIAMGGRSGRSSRCSSVGRKKRTRRANSCPRKSRSKSLSVKGCSSCN
ncbi:hypothetical protein HHI36_015276 [Cryptolaemus montrouzieri]|uniref:Protamine n=1 Tax=Cryptolaemus montrouzieri TaxID=559131 RepID=A0ABD2N593_9CUCU